MTDFPYDLNVLGKWNPVLKCLSTQGSVPEREGLDRNGGRMTVVWDGKSKILPHLLALFF